MAERFNIDHSVHQVIEPKIEFTPKIVGRLKFQRFLAEQGKFDRPPHSVPRGEVLFLLSNVEIAGYAMQQADQTPADKLRDVIAKTGDY